MDTIIISAIIGLVAAIVGGMITGQQLKKIENTRLEFEKEKWKSSNRLVERDRTLVELSHRMLDLDYACLRSYGLMLAACDVEQGAEGIATILNTYETVSDDYMNVRVAADRAHRYARSYLPQPTVEAYGSVLGQADETFRTISDTLTAIGRWMRGEGDSVNKSDASEEFSTARATLDSTLEEAQTSLAPHLTP